MDEKTKKLIEKKQKAIYACMICKQMFKDPGMCPDCDKILKKSAA